MAPSEIPEGLKPGMLGLRKVLNPSGLWASYGDVGTVLGYDNSARAVANLNWRLGLRLADQDGAAESGDEQETRDARWFAQFPELLVVDPAFGYDPDPAVTCPDQWRARVLDLRRLLGTSPMTVSFADRLARRRSFLLIAAEREPSATLDQALEDFDALMDSL
jgi:hypothetical protein